MVAAALLFIFRQAPVTLMVRFTLPLADFGSQFSFFLSLFARRKRAISHRDQAIVGRAVDHQHFVSFYGRRRVVLALHIALLEGITRRQVPISFNSLHGTLDDLLGIWLRSGRAAAY